MTPLNSPPISKPLWSRIEGIFSAWNAPGSLLFWQALSIQFTASVRAIVLTFVRSIKHQFWSENAHALQMNLRQALSLADKSSRIHMLRSIGRLSSMVGTVWPIHQLSPQSGLLCQMLLWFVKALNSLSCMSGSLVSLVTYIVKTVILSPFKPGKSLKI